MYNVPNRPLYVCEAEQIPASVFCFWELALSWFGPTLSFIHILLPDRFPAPLLRLNLSLPVAGGPYPYTLKLCFSTVSHANWERTGPSGSRGRNRTRLASINQDNFISLEFKLTAELLNPTSAAQTSCIVSVCFHTIWLSLWLFVFQDGRLGRSHFDAPAV